MEFDHLLLEAESDNIDIIAAALTPTHERRKHILFTRPYLTNDPLMIVTLVSDQPPVDSTSLYNKQTIVNDNYTAEIYMKSQQQEHPEIQLQHLATPHEAFFALIHGHAYAYVASASTVQFFLDTYGREKFATVPLNVSDAYALAVPKSAPQMFKEVEEAFNTLRADGTLTHLKEKWHLIF
jgi:ABC-type amino acid transport substrate-binding protein